MKIQGGRRRGFKLQTPPDQSVRPMLARAREAVMDLLATTLPGAAVLDLFAGTGSLGLEALSRGATHAVFVERDPLALRLLAENVERLRFGAQARILASDASAPRFPADVSWAFGIVFVDPPYADMRTSEGRRRIAVTLADLARTGRLAPGARVVLHLPGPSPIEEAVPEGFGLLDQRIYGSTQIAILDCPRSSPC
ncbi:MAG: 16S rRNA (guanine(966)-N(2))-methyltransferase RsmD [Planctomycetes bacterium]|nr:16S rRNA (guanine(966)-N(2))-methyltransferase RsmD [Planctomycetota bacterium]